jgi:nucleoside phosphorylase
MAKRRCLSVEDYTVGWVCALPIELAAAQEMLDETHDGFDNHDSDSMYTLGRIGGHNIVVACLPKGQMGTNSAATVAARLQASYPAIRFAVLVGIGGGVPSAKADIRLGDVVVSLPEKTHGGVVQYDFGKATPSGLERTGYLNAPPKILLEAVSKMQASHLRGQTRLHEYVAQFESLRDFPTPNLEQDVLFQADYKHSGGDTCENCNTGRAVQRGPRDRNMVIHYGTIASGNLVMRSGIERNRVSSGLGSVLYFEMEAAGLMNIFGCIVIRGICDYADSHKNKDWQPYASATAAAYAKELLTVIPPASVAKIRTADEVRREEQG